MIRILGIDPGSRLLGMAVLECDNACVAYMGGRHFELGDDPVPFYGATHVVIEIVDGYAFSAARVKDMVLTARMEGRIIAMAEATGLKPMTASAGDARGEFCKSRAASDDQVAIVVEALVKGAPKHLKKAQRTHIYDACLYGLAGLSRLGVKLKLPPSAETALHIQRQKERAGAAAKGKATKARRAGAVL